MCACPCGFAQRTTGRSGEGKSPATVTTHARLTLNGYSTGRKGDGKVIGTCDVCFLRSLDADHPCATLKRQTASNSTASGQTPTTSCSHRKNPPASPSIMSALFPIAILCAVLPLHKLSWKVQDNLLPEAMYAQVQESHNIICLRPIRSQTLWRNEIS